MLKYSELIHDKSTNDSESYALVKVCAHFPPHKIKPILVTHTMYQGIILKIQNYPIYPHILLLLYVS